MNVEFFIFQSFSEELRKQHAYEFGCVNTSLILSMKLKMQGDLGSELLQFRGLYKKNGNVCVEPSS